MASKQNIIISGAKEALQNVVEEKGISKTPDVPTYKEEYDEDLDKPYVDKREIIISPAHNYSNYRKVNMKVLGHRKEVIGSCIRSCQVLSSNAGEIEAYFPALIGISANNPDFLSRVKAWLSNIQLRVNEENVKLNTSFIYNHKRDYLAIQKQEDEINAEFDRIDRTDTRLIKEGVKKKVDALNLLESSKYQYGRPENVEEYLMYRHCLLYHDVAKDSALINSDSSLRFYIRDEAKELQKQKTLVVEKQKAMRNFIEISAKDDKFNSVYIAIVVFKNDNVSEALLKDKLVKQSVVMDFVNSNPDKFNKFVEDKNLTMKAFIETLISRGELVRSDYNQQISLADGTFVGANMNDAIAWFDNPANKDYRTALENKVKLL